MKASLSNSSMFSETQRPYLAMIFTQFIYAGNALFSKAAVDVGMQPQVFVAYRQGIAALALAPFTLLLERKKAPTLTFSILFKIFLASLFGLTLSMNLFYIALNYTSATYAAAAANTIPAITFIIAAILRVETISVRHLHGAAKVLGAVVCVSGALLVALDKGPTIKFMNWYSSTNTEILAPSPSPSPAYNSKMNLIKGVLIMLSSNASWSLWLVVQGFLIKTYPAKMHLTNLQCLFSSIISAIYAAIFDRNLSSWRLGWNVQLLSIAYCGFVVTGITYWLQVWCIEKKGPVFTAMFSPLALLITAVFSAFIWKETIHLGSILGAVLLVGGLYSVLWGKNKEEFHANVKKAQTSQEVKEEEAQTSQEVKEEGTELESITYT